MARAADPAGKRTVGIITKCDALQPGDEQGVCRGINLEIESLLMKDRFFESQRMRSKS